MGIESDIYNRSVGSEAGSGVGYTFSPETEKLLQAALSHGGAVAQNAAEIAHPNGTFLSYAREKAGGALTTVLDLLALPQQAIAGLVSQDYTVKEAIDKKIFPSDLVFGEATSESTTGKVGIFGARMVTDLLLDPLTYITFGTSAGITGVSKLAQIPLKASTARKLGLETTTIVDDLGNVTEEAVRFRSVSGGGLEALNKAKSRIEATIERDTLESFYQDSNVRGRLNRLAYDIRQGGVATADSALATRNGAEYILAEELKKIYSAGSNLTADQLRVAEQVAIKNAMQEQADRLVRNTLQIRRGEIEEQAKRAISNLIEQNVERGGIVYDKLGRPVANQFGTKMIRDLAKEWVDKGGIKFFGYSVVSGARIASVGRLLQQWSYLDKVKGTALGREIVAGNRIMRSLVDTNWTVAGRVPDSLVKIRDRAKNRQDVKTAELFSFLPKLYQKLGVTETEDRFISAAIASDMPPTSGGDGRLETLWSLIHTKSGNEVAEEIANGKYGDDIVRMWRAANAIKEQMKRNLTMSHEAGLHVYPQKNYIPGILNEQKSVINPFVKHRTALAVNAEKAELVKWRNVEDPTQVLWGTQESLGLKRLSKVEERQRIEREIQEAVIKNQEKKLKINSEVEELWDKINEKQVRAILEGSEGVIRESAIDKRNREALSDVISQAVPALDRKRILEKYVHANYENGAKILKSAKQLSAEDILKLKKDLAMEDEDLSNVAKNVLDNLESFGVKTQKAGPSGSTAPLDDYQEKLQEMKKLVTDIGMQGKREYLKEALDTPAFNDVMQGLAEKWYDNPGVINRIMESILGKEFEIASLMEDLADTRRGLEAELKNPGLKRIADRWFYKDTEGKMFERLRASAKEINENYFNGEEMFSESALKQTLLGSLSAIRAANSRYMLEDIAKRFGVPAGSAPSNFVRLGIKGLDKEAIDMQRFQALMDGTFSMKNGLGEELFFHPTVAQSVNEMLAAMVDDPASQIVAKGWDKMTNLWKASVTSIWPAFHGRNALSNVFQHYLDIGLESINPVNHTIAIQMIKMSDEMDDLGLKMASGDPEAFRKLTDLQSKVIVTDKRGYKWTAGELIGVARRNVVAFNPTLVGQIDINIGSREVADELMDKVFDKPFSGRSIRRGANPLSQGFKPFQYGRNVGNYIETQARLVDFIANLRKTGDVEQAAFQTKQFLFDYQNLTSFEKNVMRRIVPFYTYARKNFELQVKTAFTKPGRPAVFADLVANIGDVFGDGRLTEEERAMLPEWMKDSLNIVTARNGTNLSILTTLGTPFEQPFSQFGNLAGSLNPLIKGPIEQATGYSFFNGRPLSEVTNAEAFSSPMTPKVLRDLIGYTEVTYFGKDGKEYKQYVALNVEMLNMLKNLPFTPRVISTLASLNDPEMDSAELAAQLLFAMKPNEIDLLIEGRKREKEMQRQLEDLLDKAGLGYRFDRFQLNK